MDNRIDFYRKQLFPKPTIEALADKVGCSRNHLQQVISGTKGLSDAKKKTLAAALGQSVRDVFPLDDNDGFAEESAPFEGFQQAQLKGAFLVGQWCAMNRIEVTSEKEKLIKPIIQDVGQRIALNEANGYDEDYLAFITSAMKAKGLYESAV